MELPINDPFTNYFLNNAAAFNSFIKLYTSTIDLDLQIKKQDFLSLRYENKRNLFLLMVAQFCEKTNFNIEKDYLSYFNWLILITKSNMDAEKEDKTSFKDKDKQDSVDNVDSVDNSDNINKIDKEYKPLIKLFSVNKIKHNQNIFNVKNSRTSPYGGVSKTGNRWQVLMKYKKRLYLGSYATEEEAARVYDCYAIQYFGSKAKTNFVYSEEVKVKYMNMNSTNISNDSSNICNSSAISINK